MLDILKTISRAHYFELQNAKQIDSFTQRKEILNLVNQKFEHLLNDPTDCFTKTLNEIRTEKNHERFIFLARFSGYASFYSLAKQDKIKV